MAINYNLHLNLKEMTTMLMTATWAKPTATSTAAKEQPSERQGTQQKNITDKV